jgi:hypothetical protein
MHSLIKAFRATRLGRKKGGLHLLKKSSRKRKRAEFAAGHDLSLTVADAAKTKTEADVFKRVMQQ